MLFVKVHVITVLAVVVIIWSAARVIQVELDYIYVHVMIHMYGMYSHDVTPADLAVLRHRCFFFLLDFFFIICTVCKLLIWYHTVPYGTVGSDSYHMVPYGMHALWIWYIPCSV